MCTQKFKYGTYFLILILEQASLLRQNILKKLLPRVPIKINCFLLAYTKALTAGVSTNQFFLKNFKYFKSYHGKTKILKIHPFLNFLHVEIVPDVRSNGVIIIKT